MVYCTSKDKVQSGVPLGGIGAGKMEILPNGLFASLTFLNNWSKPLESAGESPGVLGFHWGIYIERTAPNGKVFRKAYLLQTYPLLDIPTVKRIRYEGFFPQATLHFECPGSGVEVSLEALSSWIPSDVKNSSLPAVYFTLRARNTRSVPATVGFLFIGRNICGEWCVGRKNRIIHENGAIHLEFSNAAAPIASDVRHGSLRFSFLKQGWETTFLEAWNAVTKNFSFHAQNLRLSAWDHFVRDGALPNLNSSQVVQGENHELFGAVAVRRLLPAGKTAEFLASVSWHFPNHPLGHRYEKWFNDVGEVSRYVLRKRKVLEPRLRRVQQAVLTLPFPDWFNDALLANLAPFYSSTWYVKDGRFAFYEAPVACPLLGTLDVGFYGSIPLSYFFPELEISLLTQFAKAQREDGYIPHDLGRNRLDLPSNGTTFYHWKDLNPKFILMVWRDALWSGDKEFLIRLYSHVKKALVWSLRMDRDGNGLPDHEGADQTFDLWNFYGANAYTSSIFLAGLLACRRMARWMGDAPFENKCRAAFAKGSASFERELWNGRYFGETCALSQLNGQWYADLLGLGSIADPVKIKKALTFIHVSNSRHSSLGLVNAVRSNGRLDVSNDHSRNVWAGMNYAFISLCIMRGFSVSWLLTHARHIWENVTLKQKSPWNQPDTVDSKTGRYIFGDSYYRNMSIWSIPIAYAKKNKKTASILSALRSGQSKF